MTLITFKPLLIKAQAVGVLLYPQYKIPTAIDSETHHIQTAQTTSSTIGNRTKIALNPQYHRFFTFSIAPTPTLTDL